MSTNSRSARTPIPLAARTPSVDGKPIGLRERHKIDKQDRISAAALTLFARDGYDGTTLRDIAREADVALGTLSLYAKDKRDLVLMIFNKVIPPLMERGRKNTTVAGSIAANMTAFFAPFYHAYAENVTLYRIILAQIYNGPDSAHAEENNAIRIELLGHLTDILLRAVATGECRSTTDVAVQARSFFYLYFAAVRVWLFQDDPRPQDGLETLRILFEQHVEGIAGANS